MEINKNFSVKIRLLDIYPSLKEIDKNYEEILIIFQGVNVFYNLTKLLITKKEILIDNCNNSIIFSLIKSDIIFASALFNIKFGEYWIKFNFENKKKINKSTIYDFIKIKISLSELNLSKQLSKAIFQNKLSKKEYNISTYNINNSHLNGKKSIILTDEGNSKIKDKEKISPYTTINRTNINKKIEFTVFSNKIKSSLNNCHVSSLKNYNFINCPKINKTKLSSFLNLNNKYNNNVNKNPMFQFDITERNRGSSKSPRMNNNTKKSYINSNTNIDNNSNQNLFKQQLKNKVLKKNYNDTRQRNTINIYSSTITKKNGLEKSLFNCHEEINNSQKKNKKKFRLPSNSKKFDVKTEPKHKMKNICEVTEKHAAEQKNNNLENENDIDYNMQIFFKMKDDFITLYNEEYVNNVEDDLLKLEIELMVEKMCQLFFEYHNQEKEKKIEYEILKNIIKTNTNKFILQNKLKIKLELIKNKFDTKKNQNNKNEFSVQKTKSIFSANENEFNFFRRIVKIDKYDRLKKITAIVLSKNKNLIGIDKNFTNSKKLDKKNKLKKYKNDIPKIAFKKIKKSNGENSITDKIDANNSILDNNKKKYINKSMVEFSSFPENKSYKNKYNNSFEDVNIVKMQ